MNTENLQDYFCGIEIDTTDNTITYLVEQHFDEILHFLKNDTLRIDHYYNKEKVLSCISTGETIYEIEFKGDYENSMYISSAHSKPLNLYLELFLESSALKNEYVRELRGIAGIIGRKSK
ncbi:hypothetical protein [Fluviicola sp.]|uniref:hypothetical protein n=1 Tax=Fluviicola sp. TaxID=1917219 RepID=UPI00260F87DA|nr:hypothetical protein [Fluviicola sp.]